MSSSSWLFVFLLRASGHVATVQGATAPASSLVALSQLHRLLSWVLSHISQPLYLSLFCPDLPELAAHIGRLEFISEGFDLCKNPSVGQKIRDAPHSPVPSVSCHFRQMSQGFAGDAAESNHWKVGTFSDSRSSSHPTNTRTKWTSEHVCSLTLWASKKL